MAERCPESRYIGTANLESYRFQINERGFANVVYSYGHHVEGLVYLLSRTDEERLDRTEGVPTAYQKYQVEIQVFAATIAHIGRAVPEIVHHRDGPESCPQQTDDFKQPAAFGNHKLSVYPSNLWRQMTRGLKQHSAPIERGISADDAGHNLRGSHCGRSQSAKALVYMSKDFQEDSKPRNEYIDRMNAGIIDAHRLGISEDYIKTYLRSYIVERQLPEKGRNDLQSFRRPAQVDLADERSQKGRPRKTVTTLRKLESKSTTSKKTCDSGGELNHCAR
ncbi:hypothetical protein ACLMJK_003661 [Lecanora helva]